MASFHKYNNRIYDVIICIKLLLTRGPTFQPFSRLWNWKHFYCSTVLIILFWIFQFCWFLEPQPMPSGTGWRFDLSNSSLTNIFCVIKTRVNNWTWRQFTYSDYISCVVCWWSILNAKRSEIMMYDHNWLLGIDLQSLHNKIHNFCTDKYYYTNSDPNCNLLISCPSPSLSLADTVYLTTYLLIIITI